MRCEACGAATTAASPQQADAFSHAHAQHRSASATHLGLGDAVAKVAQPIARVLGRPTSCTPCEARKAGLNRMVPNFWRR